MAYTASSGSAVCSRPNPPAHHWLLALTSAPAASSTSIIARLRAPARAGESKGPIGSLILALSSGWRSSRWRARLASSAWIDSLSWSTTERSGDCDDMTNAPSRDAWSPRDQAERRFVTVVEFFCRVDSVLLRGPGAPRARKNHDNRPAT